MQLTPDEFLAKWLLRFRDNDRFEIDEADLREYTTDLADSFGTGGAAAPFTITPTVGDGDIKAGQIYPEVTSEELWRLKLTPFLAPAVTDFARDGQRSGQVRRGQPFPAGPVEFTWDISQAANLRPGSLSLLDVTAGQYLGLALVNDGRQVLAAPGFTAGLGVARTYRLSATATNGAASSADLVLTGVPSLFFGASPLTQSALLAALQNGQPLTPERLAALALGEVLQDSKILNQSYNCTGGRYIHVLWDVAYGAEPAFGQVRSGVNTFSAYSVAPVTLTDRFGILRSYRLLSTGIQYGAAVNLNILS